jgi:ABC-type molybdate transport system substrate-binding protein
MPKPWYRPAPLTATLLAAGIAASMVCAAEPPATVSVFAAGSVRGVVADLSAAAGPALNINVEATFGGSGSLRERIENGARPDILLSADLGSPHKLAAQGLTVVPETAFARNRICVVSRRDSGLTELNLVDRLLSSGVRVKTSTPVADPGGDYAWAIFDRINHLRPGSGTILKQKAQSLMNLVATPSSASQSPAAALFESKLIDLSITYCSASASLVRDTPWLASLPVPAQLDPHPVYGLALLSDSTAAMKLALFLLSEKGQEIVARNGLVPLLDIVATERQ